MAIGNLLLILSGVQKKSRDFEFCFVMNFDLFIDLTLFGQAKMQKFQFILD